MIVVGRFGIAFKIGFEVSLFFKNRRQNEHPPVQQVQSEGCSSKPLTFSNFRKL